MSELHERQRQDVAAALHNQIGQAVSAIKMSAHLILDEEDASQRREDLLDIIRIADATVSQLRQLHCQLRPPQLDALGLEAALRGEVERHANVVSEVRLELATLPSRPVPAVELACVRIAQQVLAHTLGRADAPARNSRLQVSLRNAGGLLRLRLLVDAGDHHDISPMAAGDLESLCEYAVAVGGSLRAEPAVDSCFAIELRLPFTSTSSRADNEHVHAFPGGSRKP